MPKYFLFGGFWTMRKAFPCVGFVFFCACSVFFVYRFYVFRVSVLRFSSGV